MAGSNINTVIASTLVAQDTPKSGLSDHIIMDMSRDNSPMLPGRREYGKYLYPDRSNIVTSPISSNGCLKICVSGRMFELTIDQVKRYPDSLLADPDEMAMYYQPAIGMFFFDRNRYVFEYIMQFYQSPDGYMEFPDEIPSKLLEIELAFYKIGYRSVKKINGEEDEPIYTVWDKGRRFFNDPSSSIFAKIWMGLDILFIILSVAVFVVRTEKVVEDLEKQHGELVIIFWMLTVICGIFFTLDLGGRFVFCKNKYRFFLSAMPWLDIVSIIPLYVEIFESFVSIDGNVINILKLCRMTRVARCLKLIRRSKRLILIFQILVECKEELSLLLVVWVAGTTVSGSIMYYVEEHDNKEKFYSILESCWWAITTIGTIGYGNIRPVTALGLFLTTAIIFCSMIFLTVPMTIIIRRFSDSYEKVERLKEDVKLFGATPVNTSNWSIPTRPIANNNYLKSGITIRKGHRSRSSNTF